MLSQPFFEATIWSLNHENAASSVVHFLTLYPVHMWTEANQDFVINTETALAWFRIHLFAAQTHAPQLHFAGLAVPTNSKILTYDVQAIFLDELEQHLCCASPYLKSIRVTQKQIIELDLLTHADEEGYLLLTGWSDEMIINLLAEHPMSLVNRLRLLDQLGDQAMLNEYIRQCLTEIFSELQHDISCEIIFGQYPPVDWSLEHKQWYRKNKTLIDQQLAHFSVEDAILKQLCCIAMA